jgi:hypothetical protein
MNTKLSKLITIAIVFASGIAVDHVYSSERYTELFVTRSGTFVIRSNRIYELAELDSTYAPVDKGIMK